ncbi:putative transposase [Xanthobacter flavus]|nr:putative transposase [Xanthobacter flavus]
MAILDHGQKQRTRDVPSSGLTTPDRIQKQIIGILKEHEAGVPVSDLCRKHGVSDASIYKRKARFGGMDVSEAKRLRALEDESAKLKRMLADAMLDNVALKDLLGKKW